jgi:cobalt-zinc-cadmium efflux system protein
MDPHEPVSQGARLWISVILNLTITVVEVVAGLLAGSLALLADALHNLSDVGSLLLAIAARRIGRRPPSPRHTFGYKRAEVLAALVNAGLLVGVSVLIAKEAFVRLLHPQPVAAGLMFWTAFFAFFGNMAAVWLLHRHDRHDLNVRSAFLHLLQDALVSLTVVVAAVFMGTRMGPYLDPVASIAVSFAVLVGGWRIVLESLHIVTEAVPRDLDLEALVDSMEARFPPSRIHHVHVWEVGPGERMMTAHVAVPETTVPAAEKLFGAMRRYLKEEWSIGHVTLEPECSECPDPGSCGGRGRSAGDSRPES